MSFLGVLLATSRRVPCRSCGNTARLSSKFRSSRGAAIVELAIVLSLVVAVTVPPFLYLLPHIGIADRRTKIQVGFSQVSGNAYNLQQMNLEGLMEPKGGCDVMDQLYKSALRLHQHTGIAGFCSVAFMVDVDNLGVASNPVFVLSSDETGADCAPDLSAVPPGFVAAASAGLSADLSRTQLAMGTFIPDPGGDLMTKQRVISDASSDGPGVVSTSCSCSGGACI